MSFQQVIPTQPGMGRGLINHDDRSRSFAARDLIPRGASLRDRTWRRGRAYDQGSTPHCVAFTGKGIANTAPRSRLVEYDVRRGYDTTTWYQGAQRLDEWHGEAYDGTSGLGLCRYLKAQGLIQSYAWCFGLADVLATLSHVGPVGLGVWWYESMMSPDEWGEIEVAGGRVGGHEVELIGIDLAASEVIGMNSWGEGYGDRGRFRLSWANLERLLDEDGDAFVITG